MDGFLFQSAVTIMSYCGVSIGSFFDSDIKDDMDSIGWNIFNTNENAVLESKKVSFYKGVPVFRFNYNRAGSYGIILLSREWCNATDVRHEFGHNVQQAILGPIKYGLCIGLPSMFEWSNRSYYDRPWEITADIFGGVTSRKHNNSDISRGYSYIALSSIFSTLVYTFLPGEYNLTQNY